MIPNDPRIAPRSRDRSPVHPFGHGLLAVVQAKALLLAADGVATNGVARRCGTTNDSVRGWRRRFEAEGVAGVGRIAPGRGRKSWLPEGTAEVVRATPSRRNRPSAALSEHHDAELASAALQMAVAIRDGDVRGVIFHSDKGSEYTASAFEGVCVRLGITQSMGRVGSALDNAAAESFNSTLESELLFRQRFVTKVETRRAVAGFIDRYNRLRRHSTCAMRSPIDFEADLAATATNVDEAA